MLVLSGNAKPLSIFALRGFLIYNRAFVLKNCNKCTKNNLHTLKMCYNISILRQKNCDL